MTVSNDVMWLECPRRTHFPGWKKLYLNIYSSIRGYPRDVIRGQLIKVLGAMDRHL